MTGFLRSVVGIIHSLLLPSGRHGGHDKAQPECDDGAYRHGRVSTMTITDSRSTLSALVSERKSGPTIQPIYSINAPDHILARAKTPGIPTHHKQSVN